LANEWQFTHVGSPDIISRLFFSFTHRSRHAISGIASVGSGMITPRSPTGTEISGTSRKKTGAPTGSWLVFIRICAEPAACFIASSAKPVIVTVAVVSRLRSLIVAHSASPGCQACSAVSTSGVTAPAFVHCASISPSAGGAPSLRNVRLFFPANWNSIR